jgi:hypothetical protein
MTLEDIRNICAKSEPEDWARIDFPLYAGEIAYYAEAPEGKYAHDGRAIYKPDIAISILSGHTFQDNYQADWLEDFADKSATGNLADIAYNGVVVDRVHYVVVDGGRSILPSPLMGRLTVPGWNDAIVRLLHALYNSPEPYDRYFETAGLSVE